MPISTTLTISPLHRGDEITSHSFALKNHVLKHITVYIGSINSPTVRIGKVFKEALKQNAAVIIIAHNHLARWAHHLATIVVHVDS